MTKASNVFRAFWEQFAHKMTRSAIQVDGTKREMTAEEQRLFDEAFGHFDASFDSIQKVFDEARRENARRKP